MQQFPAEGGDVNFENVNLAFLCLHACIHPISGHSPAKQISPHDCSEKVSNDTDVSVPDSCDYRWSERTTFVQCCEVRNGPLS